MNREQWDEPCAHEELAVGWAMHALEPDEEAVLRAHLPGCARCQEAVRATEEVAALLGDGVEQEEPPARLRANLLARIEDVPQETELTAGREMIESSSDAAGSQPQPRRSFTEPGSAAAHRRRSRTRVLLAAAAVLVVLAAAGGVGWRMSRLSDQVAAQQAKSAQLQQILQVAADPTTHRAILRTDAGQPAAVLLSGDTEAAVLPMGLRPNDQQKQIYVVWGTSTPSPVPLATFDVPAGADQAEVLKWSTDAAAHKGFAISLEPGRVAPAAPSTVLAMGQVTS
ncbi:hypothetical protein F0L68_24765 [Solihabitans fulvus]|uniref:Regulator of SigK n=1 Tax=Solihabitans fulvus TaxID=1892852 RepID=A0A5B2X2M1_9PSEU|nr:anti-sigma factor [Solihabitans fulvus]KAA2257516.1 hypothetical protein F0L68_24765 [Solihabitans fulvus]